MDIKDINPSSAYHVSTVESPLSDSHPSGLGGVLPYITYTGMCRPTGS